MGTLLLAQSSGNGGVMAGGAIVIVIILLVVLTSIFWIWMLIDCLISNKPPVEKIIWLLVIFFLHLLGAILYFFIGRSGRPTVV